MFLRMTNHNVPPAAQKTPQKKCLHSVSPWDINSNPRQQAAVLPAQAAALPIVRAVHSKHIPNPINCSVVDLLQNVKKTIGRERLIEGGDRVLLGISGGIDSTTLLFVLLEIRKEIAFELGLVHINHMLRDRESQRDERFVRTLAKKLSLPAYIKRVNVKRYALAKGLSIQHAGREVRYLAFNEIIEKYHYNKIAVAHNLDDQIETFLLRAVKGTGIRGLTAIPIKRETIIRPFLYTYRIDIAAYAHENNLPFVEDSSNKKTIYERNFLRKKIFPLMERLNPLFKEKLFFLLKDLTYINGLFEEKAKLFLQANRKIKNGDICLDIEKLGQVDEETKFRVVSHILAFLEPAFVPLREHFRQINKMLTTRKPNLVSILPHGIRIRKVYGDLIFTKKHAPLNILESFPLVMGNNHLAPLKLNLKLSRPQKVPETFSKRQKNGFLRLRKAGNLTVRTFLAGDRFTPLGMKSMVKLKDFFISSKIPKDDRKVIPLLFSDNDIIWVIGQRIDERFKITSQTRKILKVGVSSSQ